MFERASIEDVSENAGQDEQPFLRVGQLLRTISKGGEEAAYRIQNNLHLRGFGMHAGVRSIVRPGPL